MQLQLEQLESRLSPASSALTAGGLLSITATRPEFLVLSQPSANVVEVFDAQLATTQDFTGVKSIAFSGSTGGDTLYNNTSVPLNAKAMNTTGTTVFVGGSSGQDVLDGSASRATFYATLTASGTELGGSSFNNLFALGGTHTLVTGTGFNALYSIIGADTINATQGSGYLHVGFKATVSANAAYQIVTFFQPSFASTTSPVLLQKDANGNGILYLLPQNPNQVSFVINQAGPNASNINVIYSDAAGSQSFTFAKSQVSWIAFFSVTGVSQVTNNTTVNNVLYAKANSILVGGFGINVLKLHTGPGLAIARGTYNDLFAGPGGTATLVGGGVNNVFRNNAQTINTYDFNVHRSDVVIQPAGYINGIFSANRPAQNQDFAQLAFALTKAIF